MSVTKLVMRAGLIALSSVALSGMALAEINQGNHLKPGGQAKVNKALAKGYMQGGDDGAKRMESQSQVNIGSKRAGTCNMNVAAEPAGGRGSKKEVIVTAKEIINVCK
jgi:hypothetical protein